MIKTKLHLASNKLSILYFLYCVGIPLTNTQITRFFTESGIINYFELQQYLIELVSVKLLDRLDTRNSHYYNISSRGVEVLSFFENRIPSPIKDTIESYARENRKRLKEESQITADYKKISQQQYEITCKVVEKDITILELKLNVPKGSQAKTICKNWKTRAPEIYKLIMEHII